MQPRDLHGKGRHGARSSLAAAAFLIVVLAGCASVVSRQRSPETDAEPYVGVFTGQFVDGKRLYRFPTIEVVGSRSSIGPGYCAGQSC